MINTHGDASDNHNLYGILSAWRKEFAINAVLWTSSTPSVIHNNDQLLSRHLELPVVARVSSYAWWIYKAPSWKRNSNEDSIARLG